MDAVLDAQNGRRLTLRQLERRSGEVSYTAVLTTEAGEAEVVVWELGSALDRFVRDLADAWQGFTETKVYASIEGHLELSCRHDGKGSVECKVTVQDPSPPEWSMTADLTFGGGAHLDRVAAEVESFFGAA